MIRTSRRKHRHLSSSIRRKDFVSRFVPRIESLEERRLLAIDLMQGTGFLQGFSFVDSNSNGQLDSSDARKPGATIQLLNTSNAVLASTTTDSDGYYRFEGLASGTYRIKELPPAGFGSSGVQIQNILNSASALDASTIEVVVTEPDDDAWLSLTVNRLPGLPGVNSAYTLTGGPFNSFTQNPEPTNAHQFELRLSGGAIPGGGPSPNFYSFCMDLSHAAPSNYAVDPSLTPTPPGLSANLDRIGYLYNEFGTKLLSPTDGTGLQLALYELLYDASPNLTAGDFVVNSVTTDPAAFSAATNYLNASIGKDQRSVFLNVTPPAPTGDFGRQGMIVTENFSFINVLAPQPDARITITPNATNEVGQPHTFTVLVEKDDGLPAGAPGGDAFTGFAAAPSASVTVLLDGTNGAIPDISAPSDLAAADPSTISGLTDASGQFLVTFSSATAGQVTGHATVTLVVSGQTLVRQTDGIDDNSGDAVKTFVDAKISIAPNATNEVGQPHIFTVTVMQDDGLTAAQGGDGVTGFTVATVGNVDVTLTGSNGAVPILNAAASTSDDNQPTGDNLDASGQTIAVFTSASAGQVTGHATVTLVVGGLTLVRQTDGIDDNSGDAVKTFVDAKISIAPDATNEVGQSHTFTVTVLENAGDGAGFVAAAGETVTVTLVNVNGASTPTTTFTGTTNASGQFLVTFASPTAGQVIGNVTGTIVVGGLSLVRDTDPATAAIGAGPGGSGPATKTYVDAKISITPSATNEVGQPHTFTVTVLENAGNGAGFVAAAGETVTVTLANANGASTPTTTFTGTTNASGQFQVTFASPTAGQVVGNATSSILVGGLTLTRDTDPATVAIGAGPGGSGPATKTFVDAKIILSPLTATNPTNDPHVITATVLQDDGLTAAQGGDGVTGFAPAPNGTVVTFGLVNSDGATAAFVGGNTGIVSGGVASVTINSATAGTVTLNGTTTFLVGGVSLTRDTDPVTAAVAGPGGSGPATKIYVSPGIDLEKTTNGPTNSNPTAPDYDNEDAMDGPGVPVLTPGSTVTWTYKVTNTGGLPFTFNEVVIVDDNGTPGNAADDLSTTNGQITFLSVQTGDADNVLEPGEVWLYTASGTVLDLSDSPSGGPTTFDFSGSSALDGPDGNIRTFTSGGVSVKASAFSRDKGTGAWSTAYLGSYGGGLGVTDSSEGDGSSNTHTVDNVGRDNYVLFEFSETVVVDSAFLGYVVDDSDLTVWVGTLTDPFTNHATLSDALLASLGFTEVNLTDLATTRTADLNAGNISGNVVVIAAYTADDTPEDRFKIEKMTVRPAEHICYENKAVVTVPGDSDSDLSHYCNPDEQPGIDIEKTTNGPTNANPTAPNYDNEDAANGAGVPILTPGSAVTWTYKVTNTGNVAFAASQVVIVDDSGTPGVPGDDLSTTNGAITFLSVSVGDADNILEPGEVWLYKATGTVQTLSGATSGSPITFDFSGNSALDGSDGNIRTFTAGGVSVKASAFSRDKGTGSWSTAYLGSYGGGLGVTDSSEGSGADNTHTVDNVGRDNYVLFEFSEKVVVDSAFLGYVVNDSDLTVWIGTLTDPFNNHVTLSDALLTSLGFTEVNLTDLTTARTADINAGNLAGNVLVIAADVNDDTPDDRFKIELLKVCETTPGIYENKAVVTVPGDTDSDLSHYKNSDTPPPAPGTIKGKKWRDMTGNGLTSDDVPLGGTVIYLDADNDGVKDSGEASTVTAADGTYQFAGLPAGTYVVREVLTAGFVRTSPTLSDRYVVSLASGAVVSGKDFANFETCDDCELTNVYYTIKRGSSTLTVSSLSGNTEQGDEITVTFTVPAGHGPEYLSLVSYTAPSSYFDAEEADLQRVYEAQTGFFLPGTHSLSIDLPCSYYQVDFVCGPIIDKFGPAGSNIFYTPQGRLLGADNDGDNSGSANPWPEVTLVVGGGSGNDDIRFNVAGDPSKISVLINSSEAGQVSFGSGSGVTITRLAANGNAGADTIKVANAINIDAVLRGGSGNDTVTGGGGADILLGEAGDDKLYGYLGRDLMIGGAGKDTLYGNAADDILIGGTTSYDANLKALDAIMREWTRNDTYSNRVGHLKGTLAGGLNGSYRLIADGANRTVFDDSVQDILYGEDGKDWFLGNTDADGGSANDLISTVSGEIVTDID